MGLTMPQSEGQGQAAQRPGDSRFPGRPRASQAAPIGGGGVWSTLWALCRADGLTRLFRGGWPLFWYGYVTGAAWWITVETVQAQMQCGKRQ